MCVFILFCVRPTYSRSFLQDGSESVEAVRDMQEALAASQGCGQPISEQTLSGIRAVMVPMWKALPKNEFWQIGHRSLRYLMHRYFMQVASISIKGFEPSKSVNASYLATSNILSEQMPALLSILESKHALQSGFSLDDAVSLASVLDHLILSWSDGLLMKHYDRKRKSVTKKVGFKELVVIFKVYIIEYMLGETPRLADNAMRDRRMLESTVPHWTKIEDFVEGLVKTFEFDRRRSPQTALGADLLKASFSFEDAQKIAASITSSFQSFWQSECIDMKNSLVSMDKFKTGRVPISLFYDYGEHRFAESEPYLREMGALDETSRWRGKQVIISNYLQAASNCIISTPNYHICCVNECELFMGEVETAVGADRAPPAKIIEVVRNISFQHNDEEPVSLEGALAKQLAQIAAEHGGEVPIHGRLFAQWLHYVFPQECAFPHKVGDSKMTRPREFQGDYMVAQSELRKHAVAAANAASEMPDSMTRDDFEWMSQWSQEEELMASHIPQFEAPWENESIFRFLAVFAVAVIAVAGILTGMNRKGELNPRKLRSHYV